MIAMSCGLGTNSAALIVELVKRGEHVDVILFADTGAERPETYAYAQVLNEYCEAHGFPTITIVRKGGNGETLEENCLRKSMLPSLAYGFKSCSHKFKIQPQEKWCNNNPDMKAAWKRGEKVTKLIGYDADESHRWKNKDWTNDKYIYRAPLVEWDMGRDDCIAAIQGAGLPLPGKSSCFMCPASRLPEIHALPPDLLARALAIEDKAMPNLTSVKGLGRRFNWREVIEIKAAAVMEPPDMDCGCYDGAPD